MRLRKPKAVWIMSDNTESQKYYNVKTAAGIMGIQNERYAMKLLGKPDAVESCKTGFRNLYTLEHIESAKQEILRKRSERLKSKGLRCCYLCRIKFKPEELKSSICAACRAKKTVLNFSCCGDCTKCEPSRQRLQMLRCAVDELDEKIINQNQKKNPK